MIKKESRNKTRKARHARVRSKVFGTSECPRLNVFRSNTNIYAQIIDDENMKTLVSASSLDMHLKGNNIETAKKVGAEVAKKAKALKIKNVVFDRGGYKYHGRVLALAEAARENGLEF
ncbi:MAG: 50S ribosomal protein L18 [Bacilli bacterium]|nr:50S ribosomal protein L18 [Bacilli bacterium]